MQRGDELLDRIAVSQLTITCQVEISMNWLQLMAIADRSELTDRQCITSLILVRIQDSRPIHSNR